MRLHTYRDENRSRHFDLISGGDHPRSIDMVSALSAGVLVLAFAFALMTKLSPWAY
jgi:hypothetical protein